MRCLKLLCLAACPIILTRHSAVAWLAAATHERLQHSSPCKFCTTHMRAPPMCTTLHLANALAASQRLSNSRACAPQPCSLPCCDVLCCAVLCCQPHAGQHMQPDNDAPARHMGGAGCPLHRLLIDTLPHPLLQFADRRYGPRGRVHTVAPPDVYVSG